MKGSKIPRSFKGCVQGGMDFHYDEQPNQGKES